LEQALSHKEKKMSLLLGLDIGTTSIKAALYDPSVGQVVSLAARPTPVTRPAPGLSEHDPEALWEAVVACLREAVAGGRGYSVAGLAIASLAEAGLPLDAAGRPLYPIIAWYDRRSEPQAAWWDSQIPADRLHAITGQRVSSSFGVTKWLWLRENHPEIAARMAIWLPVPDYIRWRLTGEFATDYTIASRTLLFDQQRLSWSAELLSLAGLEPHQLPPAFPGGTPVGQVSAAAAGLTGLRQGTLCVLAGHDHLCAALAAGAYRPGVAVDSCGTAEAVVTVTPRFVSTPALAEGGFASYAHVVPGQYIVKAGLKAAGGAVEWLARLLAGPEARSGQLPYEALTAAAMAGVGTRAGPIWLPHLIGSGTPEGDPLSLAAMVGARAEHDAGDLFRGLLESLAFWLRHNLDALTALTGQGAEEVVLLGGATRLALLSQLKADVLGRPVVLPELPEATATGAALLAGLGTGLFRSAGEAVASLRYGRQTLAADPSRQVWYNSLYQEVYCPLYAALRAVNHSLARAWQAG